MFPSLYTFFFFFFNDTATTEIYTLSLHDALPILVMVMMRGALSHVRPNGMPTPASYPRPLGDRKSTRLNSSHSQISYAVFCLKKKKKDQEASSVVTSHQRISAYRNSPR